ncbi:hypothetical protein AWH63_21285 [Marinobacter sp. C18]|nr:hypothetical protein AWH63_21285 [Marinobacter sp. C18]
MSNVQGAGVSKLLPKIGCLVGRLAAVRNEQHGELGRLPTIKTITQKQSHKDIEARNSGINPPKMHKPLKVATHST